MQKKATPVRELHLIHQALLTGQILFAGIALFMVTSGRVQPAMESADRTLQLIALAIAGINFFAGAKLLSSRCEIARESAGSINEKFMRYRSASIIQWALLEAAGLFCTIAFLLTANLSFIFLAGTMIILLGLQAPTIAKIALLLRAQAEELETL